MVDPAFDALVAAIAAHNLQVERRAFRVLSRVGLSPKQIAVGVDALQREQQGLNPTGADPSEPQVVLPPGAAGE
jgi:hypothetical protein